MLTKTELGRAIERAIDLKLEKGSAKSKAEIARHFDMQPPSLADWVKKGSVAKDKLHKMFRYFADVVGPNHWGLEESEWPVGLTSRRTPAVALAPEPRCAGATDSEEALLLNAYRSANADQRAVLLAVARTITPPDVFRNPTLTPSSPAPRGKPHGAKPSARKPKSVRT